MVVNIIDQLRETGLSEYEARSYMTLLEQNPLTAYECAREAGIPTSKIYGVMKKLGEKELVLELAENGKKRYIPQEPEDYIADCRFRMEKNLRILSDELKHPPRKKEISYVWNISRKDDLIQRAEKMISRCRSSLLLSLWPDEYALLKSSVDEKRADGVKTAIVLYGKLPEGAKDEAIFEHPIEDTLYAEKGGRGFTLVSDGAEALSGTLSEEDCAGAWSRSKGFVTLAEDYVKHDIYIMKIVRRFDGELVERFGEGYALLRDIYSDKSFGSET